MATMMTTTTTMAMATLMMVTIACGASYFVGKSTRSTLLVFDWHVDQYFDDSGAKSSDFETLVASRVHRLASRFVSSSHLVRIQRIYHSPTELLDSKLCQG